MRTYPHLIICEHCDTVYQRRALVRGEVASCARCGAVLFRASRLNVDQWLALTVAAGIVFALANLFPVIRISLQGQQRSATLWQAAAALWQGAAAPIAVPAALTVIVVPLLQILLLLWILGFLRQSRKPPGLARAMRWLRWLRPWSMVEVCLLASMVTIVKLGDLLDVWAGVGVWASAALTLLLTTVASRDSHWIWRFVEDLPE